MKRWLFVALGAAVIISAFFAPFILPRPAMFWVLSVGQGEAALYRDVTGKLFLFDGGPDDTVLSELGRVLPPWERRIDIMALSHLHADHVRGLIFVTERYQVSEAWENGSLSTSSDIERWREDLEKYRIRRLVISAGHIATLGETRLSTLFPLTSMKGKKLSDANDGSLVVQIHALGNRILLTGDLHERNEAALLKACQPPSCSLKSDILQIPHHGSATGLSVEFLAAVKPRLAFICVGQKNKFKHPREEILTKLQQAKVPYHRTDEQGGLAATLYQGSFVYGRSGSPPR